MRVQAAEGISTSPLSARRAASACSVASDLHADHDGHATCRPVRVGERGVAHYRDRGRSSGVALPAASLPEVSRRFSSGQHSFTCSRVKGQVYNHLTAVSRAHIHYDSPVVEGFRARRKHDRVYKFPGRGGQPEDITRGLSFGHRLERKLADCGQAA